MGTNEEIISRIHSYLIKEGEEIFGNKQENILKRLIILQEKHKFNFKELK